MTGLTDPNPATPAARDGERAGLPVRPGEEPWTSTEIAEVRDLLVADIARIAQEVEVSEADLMGLMRDDGGGAGDDTADAGGKVLEREQELTLTQNSKLLLAQSQRALERLSDGSYGRCESCDEPIGKLRLQAFPRATLCVACKQRQERR